jgi:hypothetical protein
LRIFFSGLNKSKNFNQEQFVSRKDAVKDWKLKEHDLAEIKEETVYHKKRREGLFYPLNSVKYVLEVIFHSPCEQIYLFLGNLLMKRELQLILMRR